MKDKTYAQACPVSLQKIDKHFIKFYSGSVLFVLIFTLLTPYKFAMYAITVDFFIRVFFGVRYSPLCYIITHFLQITALKPVLVDSGRKKIAAQVGFIFSLLISLCCIFHFHSIMQALILLFSTAILIDLIFDYCLACKMQSLWQKFKF